MGQVHNFTAFGFICGTLSIGYVFDWFPVGNGLQPAVYFVCILIVLITTVYPALVLMGFAQQGHGKYWGWVNGFGTAVALLLFLLAVTGRQALIPLHNATVTTS